MEFLERFLKRGVGSGPLFNSHMDVETYYLLFPVCTLASSEPENTEAMLIVSSGILDAGTGTYTQIFFVVRGGKNCRKPRFVVLHRGLAGGQRTVRACGGWRGLGSLALSRLTN